ncbi:MFS transporter [Agrobacterium sp. P15N1-A]|uniref:MFS transporter n=1 Tax=Agrobacterium sp. P15N1-A TaxID=3342820 RepID=UPI0037D2B49E
MVPLLFQKQIASAALVNLSRTIYITTLSWTAMQVGRDFSSVGQVLLWGNVAGLVISPFSGVLIDKNDRKLIALSAAALFSISMMAFAVIAHQANGMPIFWLLSIVAGLGQAVVIPTQEAIIQGATPEELRRSLAPTLNMVRQAGLILGTLIGGFLVWLSPTMGFCAAAATMTTSALLLLSVNDRVLHNSKPSARQFFQGLSEGARFMKQPVILSYAIISVSAYAVGQISNSVLPGYIEQVLSLSAWHFGVVDSMWSLGAFGTALAIARSDTPKDRPWLARFGLVVMAGSFVVLSVIHSFLITIVMFLAMGLGFSVSKILSDSYLLVSVPNQYFGRVRSNLSTFTSLMGILIYALPSVWSNATVQDILLFGSVLLIIAFAATYLVDRDNHARVGPRS